MDFITESIQALSRQLYPNGRAFWMPAPLESDDEYISESGDPYTDESGDDYVSEDPIKDGGILYRLHRALGISEAKLWTDARSTYDSIFPDNDNFTMQDALDWNVRLGIVTNNTDFATMKAAIIRKMNYPGTVAPRQSAVYLQEQLQAAGFDLYIYENYFPDGMGGYYAKTPAEVLGLPTGQASYGNFDYGQLDYGATYALEGVTIIANHIEAEEDADFVIGDNYFSTFYIAGSSISTFASVPLERQSELRQLILTIKPLQAVGFCFINYV